MVNFGSLLKNALVVVVLVAVVESGAAAEKLASCCKTVTNVEIKEPILGYLVQRPNPPCVRAVIFQTETGLFCSQVNAPWVRPKIVAFEKAKAKATTPSVASTSPVSLLSIITSTASPSSSPTTLSSSSSFTLLSSSSSLPSSSTSKMPVDETLSEGSAE
uniref:Chemokine interleukin-8-like domain-containing protein n=1 Tax=Amphiprion ocellaris TaxID=80972 RepID=A0A3Q1AIE5_AMPOC